MARYLCLVDIDKDELASEVMKRLGINDRIMMKFGSETGGTFDGIFLRDCLDDNKSRAKFEDKIGHIATSLVVLANNKDVEEILHMLQGSGKTDEEARVFAVNVSFSALMRHEKIDSKLQEEVKKRLGLE